MSFYEPDCGSGSPSAFSSPAFFRRCSRPAIKGPLSSPMSYQISRACSRCKAASHYMEHTLQTDYRCLALKYFETVQRKIAGMCSFALSNTIIAHARATDDY